MSISQPFHVRTLSFLRPFLQNKLTSAYQTIGFEKINQAEILKQSKNIAPNFKALALVNSQPHLRKVIGP